MSEKRVMRIWLVEGVVLNYFTKEVFRMHIIYGLFIVCATDDFTEA